MIRKPVTFDRRFGTYFIVPLRRGLNVGELRKGCVNDHNEAVVQGGQRLISGLSCGSCGVDGSGIVSDSGDSSGVGVPRVGGMYSKVYFRLNALAVACHVLNAIGILIAYEVHLRHIKRVYAFVSPVVPLRWTNHALVLVDSTESRCRDVSRSPHFTATMQRETSYPPRDPFSDFMGVFNFSNTDIIEYNRVGSEINLNMMMLSFCLLSVAFQTTHGILLSLKADMPRFLHYLEYSFSSPLMVMVMALLEMAATMR